MPNLKEPDATLFQFHTGSIEGAGQSVIDFAPHSHFNSTLVRLKEAPPVIARGEHLKFQFHTGSIEGV